MINVFRCAPVFGQIQTNHFTVLPSPVVVTLLWNMDIIYPQLAVLRPHEKPFIRWMTDISRFSKTVSSVLGQYQRCSACDLVRHTRMCTWEGNKVKRSYRGQMIHNITRFTTAITGYFTGYGRRNSTRLLCRRPFVFTKIVCVTVKSITIILDLVFTVISVADGERTLELSWVKLWCKQKKQKKSYFSHPRWFSSVGAWVVSREVNVWRCKIDIFIFMTCSGQS